MVVVSLNGLIAHPHKCHKSYARQAAIGHGQLSIALLTQTLHCGSGLSHLRRALRLVAVAKALVA